MRKKLTTRALVSLTISMILLLMPMIAVIASKGTITDAEAITKINGQKNVKTASKKEVGGKKKETKAAEKKKVCDCLEECTENQINSDCEWCMKDYEKCKYEKNAKASEDEADSESSTEDPENVDGDEENESVIDKDSEDDSIVSAEKAENQEEPKEENQELDDPEDVLEEEADSKTEESSEEESDEKPVTTASDHTAPTLIAAVSKGVLVITAEDEDSGVEAIYVNGNEYVDFNKGKLSIRLQQFDTSYEYFLIQAVDCAGNASKVYKVANPYYVDPTTSDSTDNTSSLPEDAKPSEPTEAKATVTNHVKTDKEGNVTLIPVEKNSGKNEYSPSSGNDTKEKENASESVSLSADSSLSNGTSSDNRQSNANSSNGISEEGREFFTIQTESDKVFYLVVDRSGSTETVYFLTEVSENDLLNVTSNNSDTLPQNTAVVDSAVPDTTGSIWSINQDEVEDMLESSSETETEVVPETEAEEDENKEKSSGNKWIGRLASGLVFLLVLGIAAFLKFGDKRKLFKEDEDSDDYLAYESETENYFDDSDVDEASYEREEEADSDDMA